MRDGDFVLSTALPEASLAFTIPSLHDGLPIDCRLYHPQSLGAPLDSPPWQRHAAIVAHPYAPLGGCYDDPVVEKVAATLLKLGFLVATFNFRGARGSAGKTSWTGKAERADYMSVVGFVVHYVHFLDPHPPTTPSKSPTDIHEHKEVGLTVHMRPPASRSSQSASLGTATSILLLAGYSYGSMITTQLPSLKEMLAAFDTPDCASHATEVRMRAQHLAETQSTTIARAAAAAVDAGITHTQKSLGLRVGGLGESPNSQETRRPLSVELEESLRHGVAELIARAKKEHCRFQKDHKQFTEVDGAHGAQHSVKQQSVSGRLLPVPGGLSTFREAYLLVSPLQGLVTNLATMSFPSLSNAYRRVLHRFSARTDKARSQPGLQEFGGLAGAVSVEAEQKLVRNSTLAIYGDRDEFVPAQKLREWASRLQGVPESMFRAHEVSSANHFWTQPNVARILRESIEAFAVSLLDGNKEVSYHAPTR